MDEVRRARDGRTSCWRWVRKGAQPEGATTVTVRRERVTKRTKDAIEGREVGVDSARPEMAQIAREQEAARPVQAPRPVP